MTGTVPCPDCARPATVLGRFTVAGPDGLEYVRIRCGGALALLVPASEIRMPPPDRAGQQPSPA